MVALAWLVVGWPGLGRVTFSLGRRLAAAAVVAVLAFSLHMLRLPLDLARGSDDRQIVLPRGEKIGIASCR